MAFLYKTHLYIYCLDIQYSLSGQNISVINVKQILSLH